MSKFSMSTIALHQITASSSFPPATITPRPPPPPPPASALPTKVLPQQPLSKHEVDRKPWKYIGYRGYIDLLASEENFLIFRKFTAANTRVGLMLQNQVSVLEKQLAELDDYYSERATVDIHNGSFRLDHPDRIHVIKELHQKLKEYSKSTTTINTQSASTKQEQMNS